MMKNDCEISTKKAMVIGSTLVALVGLMALAMCTAGSKSSPLPADPAFSSGMQPVMNSASGQLVAFGQGGLTLPMGVTLVGRGSVEALVPGSPADRAGIQVGDIINRINGR